LHKNLDFRASGQALLQKVISKKHLEPVFKNNPRQNVSRGCGLLFRVGLAYLVVQPPGALMIGLLGGGGGGRQFPVEPFAPLGPQLIPPVGGDGGGSPFTGTAKAAPNVESSNAMTSA
jgi:hypothetical protein